MCTAKLVGTRTTRANQAKHKHHQEDRWLEFTTCEQIEASFRHTDRVASKPTGVCTAKLVKTNMFVHFISRTNEQPNTLAFNCRMTADVEAIVRNLELTDDPEEATETHASAGELRTRIVEGDDPGQVQQPHHVACTVVEKILITLRRQNANGGKPRHLRGNPRVKKTAQV